MRTLRIMNSNKILRSLVTAVLGLASVVVFAQPDGKEVFESNCTVCHKIGQKLVGPNLEGIGERRSDEWMVGFIGNSRGMIDAGDKDAVKVWEENNKAEMTAFKGILGEDEIKAVVEYIKVAKPEVAPPPPTDKKLPSVEVEKPMDPNVIILISIIVLPVILMVYLLAIVSLNLSRYLNAERRASGEQVPEGNFITGRITDEVIEGHSYDGIKELNNNMPPWLMWIFYGTALFAVIYIYIYMIAKTGDDQVTEYKKEMAEAVEKYGDLDVVKIAIEPVTDQVALNSAKEAFTSNCVACHGTEGEGNSIGPNLTDEYWLNGGKLEDIFNTIREGRPSKGMISWKGQFSDSEILGLASFIKSLKGSNPPNAKAPQGEKHEE